VKPDKSPGPALASPAPAERQRLDKWLWFARIARTRSAAAELVDRGHVRVNGRRADAIAKGVKQGDILTIALDRTVLVLKVVAFGQRRGPYEEARRLYENMSDGPDGQTPED
jgi:ribosome-associated heat shock protein Hsp15